MIKTACLGGIMMFRRLQVTAVFLLLFVLTGCMFGPQQTSKPIDPPPPEVELDAKAVDAKQTKEKAENDKKSAGTELYFLTDTGYVVPYTLKIPVEGGIAKQALRFMVKGGPAEALLPKGFMALLPKGTQVKGLNIQDGIATVDFSKEFLNYPEDQEEKVVNAVTWTLTGFANVEKVNIWVDGKSLSELPKQKTPAQNLSRNRGINLEVAEGVEIHRAMPVTLYFLGQNPDNEVYYVPVTRMINRHPDVALRTLQELIRGPKHQSGLSGAFDHGTAINKVQVQGKWVVADLGEQLLEYSSDHKASKDAIQTLVLSLTENTKLDGVKLTVNGKTDGLSITKKQGADMVSRPEFINPQDF